MKKTNVIIICCALLLAVCAVVSAFVIKGGTDVRETVQDDRTVRLYGVLDDTYSRLAAVQNSNAAAPSLSPSSSDDAQFKTDLLHFYAQSTNIVSILPFTTVQVTEAALLKAFMSSATSVNEALAYIDRYADRTLASAYETMDELLEKYSAILQKYNISTSSAYTAKYNRLTSMFASLKNSSTQLLSRTRTLIKKSKSEDYDTYYTNYVEQLSDLTGKIEQYCAEINNEYYNLLSSLTDDYDDIQ